MPDPRELLICLLAYIKDQTKEVNPEAFRLSTSKGFVRQRADLAGLHGVEFDIKVAGNHLWLRVPRLAAEQPPCRRHPTEASFVSAPIPVANSRVRSFEGRLLFLLQSEGEF
jgi:hypothetical protein